VTKTNAGHADAIILACWDAEDTLIRQLDMDAALIPMADKPMLQRVLEKLVVMGCRHIAVVHGDRPQQAEALLGDGERWGCRVSHHYAAEGSRPLRVLMRLVPADEQTCVLASADTLPLVDMDRVLSSAVCSSERGQLRWTGWAVLPASMIRLLGGSAKDRSDLGMRIAAGLNAGQTALQMCDTVSTTNVVTFLNSLPRLASASPGTAGIMRRPESDGVWIGKGSRLSPSARLRSPVFIGQNVLVGENADIGPNVMIGDGCIVDADCRMEDCILLPNTYVGEGLEARGTILAGDRLVNARMGVTIRVPDPVLLRDLDREYTTEPRVALGQRALARVLRIFLAPINCMLRPGDSRESRITLTSIGVPCAQTSAFRSSPVSFAISHGEVAAGKDGAWAAHFAATFLPGLKDAAEGRVALVGLQPRTAQEITQLPLYWQRLYRHAPIGLLSETLLQGIEGGSPEMAYASDALCSAPLPLRRVLRVLWLYAGRVITDILARKFPPDRFTSNAASQPDP